MKSLRYCSGSRTKIDGNSLCRQSRGGTTGQWFALPARYVHSTIDSDFRSAEHGEASDPRERFATESSFNHGRKNEVIALGTLQEFLGLFASGDEPGVGQARRDVVEFVYHSLTNSLPIECTAWPSVGCDVYV